jgi:hypothetical protein
LIDQSGKRKKNKFFRMMNFSYSLFDDEDDKEDFELLNHIRNNFQEESKGNVSAPSAGEKASSTHFFSNPNHQTHSPSIDSSGFALNYSQLSTPASHRTSCVPSVSSANTSSMPARTTLISPRKTKRNYANPASSSASVYEADFSSIDRIFSFASIQGLMDCSPDASMVALDQSTQYNDDYEMLFNPGDSSILGTLNSAINENRFYQLQLQMQIEFLDELLLRNHELQKRFRSVSSQDYNPLKKRCDFVPFFHTANAPPVSSYIKYIILKDTIQSLIQCLVS